MTVSAWWLPVATLFGSITGTILTRIWTNTKIPEVGKAWCENCSLNHGRTMIVPVENMTSHIRLHNPTDYIKISGTRVVV